jgi:hypothetical protein
MYLAEPFVLGKLFKTATYMGNFTCMEQKKTSRIPTYFSCRALNSQTVSFYIRVSDSHPAFFLPIATTSNKKNFESVTTVNEKCRCCEFGDKGQ